MSGDVTNFAFANFALTPLYMPLMMLSAAGNNIDSREQVMDNIVLVTSYIGVSAFIFPIVASTLTFVTQDLRFLALDLLPPLVLSGGAMAIKMANKRV